MKTESIFFESYHKSDMIIKIKDKKERFEPQSQTNNKKSIFLNPEKLRQYFRNVTVVLLAIIIC